MIVYRRRRLVTLEVSLLIGLLVVAVAVATSIAFRLEPIYFTILVLVYAFIAGNLIKALGSRLVRTPPQLKLPQTSEKEIEEIVTRRGYGNLVSKSKRHRKSKRRR